jgi:hypothetical protein
MDPPSVAAWRIQRLRDAEVIADFPPSLVTQEARIMRGEEKAVLEERRAVLRSVLAKFP